MKNSIIETQEIVNMRENPPVIDNVIIEVSEENMESL